MNYRLFGLLLMYMIFGTSLLLNTSGAYFTDTALSESNTFQAAETFDAGELSVSINPGDVVINEIMWMGTQINSADEWIELRNMTNNPIDLSEWTIKNLGPGINNITLPQGTLIPANGYYLIANDPESDGAHNVTPDFQINISLNNQGEQLVLQTSTGIIIDSANSSSGGWFAGENETGQNPINKSMERNTLPGDGTDSTNWKTASSSVNLDTGNTDFATPKAENSSGF